MEFRVLGPLQVWCGGREVEVAAGRHRALLAALLLRANQVVATEQLASWIWGEAPPGDARATAQTYIRRLRAVLGDGLIHTRPGGYLITVAPDRLDLTRFDGLLERARHAAEPATEAALLADALALWRGEALANVPSDTLHRDEVPVLTERRLRALERRLDLELGVGHHADLVAELRALTAQHPLRERFWAQLMTALAGCGRQAEALHAYQDLRTRLADELGAEPDAGVQQVHLSILRGELRPPPVAGSGPRRADVPTPVRPAQLPPDVAAFTGRAEQLWQLDALLAGGEGGSKPSAVVISAIEGTAGIGKTALAVHWAHRVRGRFPDGQLYVDLRGHAAGAPLRPAEALARFLHALGVPAARVPVEVDEAAAVYRSLLADKRMLVLLDNAAHADQVRPLLPGGAGCLVVVTSRDQLGGLVARDGAHPIALDALTADEARALLARLLGPGRVRAEPDATMQLTDLCGRLPLALRIAAANLAAHPQHSIATYTTELRTGDRLAALTTRGDDQATVRAAFDLSYTHLGDPARRMFRLLGLVPGPDVTTGAAAALADTAPHQARQLLETLTAAHLVDQRAPGRYTLHDLLRLYAADRARQEDTEADRHAALHRLHDHYVRAADAAARLLYPHVVRLPQPTPHEPAGLAIADHATALEWLDAERANLVATVTQAATHGPHRVAWQLADALHGYFHARVSTVDWIAVAHAGLAAAESDGDLHAQAAAHLNLAGLGWRQSRYRQAVDHTTQALALTRLTGWVDGQAAALSRLGTLHLEAGRLDQAADHLLGALALYEQSHRPGQATALGNLGVVYLWMGRLHQAFEHASRALSMNRETGSGNGEATNLATLGEIHRASGRFDLALDHLEQALAHYRAVGNRVSEGATLCSLAELHRDAGGHAQALELANTAVCLARDTGHPRLEAGALTALANVHHQLGDQQRAIDGYQRAMDLARRTGNRYPHAEALIGVAAAHQHMGRHERATAYARHALTITRRAGYRLLEGQALITLAEARLGTNDTDQAVGAAEQALAIHGEAGNRIGEARAHYVLGHARRHTGHPDAAVNHWQRALALYAQIGIPHADQVRGLLRTVPAAPATPPPNPPLGPP